MRRRALAGVLAHSDKPRAPEQGWAAQVNLAWWGEQAKEMVAAALSQHEGASRTEKQMDHSITNKRAFAAEGSTISLSGDAPTGASEVVRAIGGG